MKHDAVNAREFALHALLLIALVAALFPGTFLRGEMTLPGGLLFDYAPWSAHRPPDLEPTPNWLTGEVLYQFNVWYPLSAQAVREGDWPLWNPLQMTGMPLLANYQTAPFYPPRLLHLVLDPFVATTVFMLLRLWLCGANAYICARVLGLGVAASRFFSVAFMLCGYALTWFYWPEPGVIAWLPILFLGTELILRGRFLRGHCAMTLGGVMLMLAGHPESAFAASLGTGVYFFTRLIWERRWGRGLTAPLIMAASAWMTILLVTAPQWMPFLEYAASHRHIDFHASNDRADPHAVPLDALLCFFVPRFFGSTADGNYWSVLNSTFVTMFYPGIAVWVALLLLRPRVGTSPVERARLAGLAAGCAAGVALAFDFPGIRIVHEAPVFGLMWRCWHLTFVVFALPLLGAIGLEQWLARPRSLRDLLAPCAAALLAGAAAFALYAFHRRVLVMQGYDGFIRAQLVIAALLCALCLGAIVVRRLGASPRVCAGLFTVVLAADLVFAARDFLPTAPRAWFNMPTALTDYLLTQTPAPRVNQLSARMPSGLLQSYGIEQWWGYDAMVPKRFMTYNAGLDDAYYAAMEPVSAIDYYLLLEGAQPLFPIEEPDRFEFVGTFDGIEVYRNLRAFPRAYLAQHAEVVTDLDGMVAAMRRPDFDPRRTALLESPPSAPLPAPVVEVAPGSATVAQRSTTRVRVEVDASAPAVMVLSDAYYPGWEAMVDGVPAEVFPVFHQFRGVMVPAGRSTVVFRYWPRLFGDLLAASMVCLVAELMIVYYALRRGRARARILGGHGAHA